MKRSSRIFRRLKRRSGESIGEVLISVLISAVALVMLASMITTSAGLVKTGKDKLQQYYVGQDALTQYSETDVPEGVSIDADSVTIRQEGGSEVYAVVEVKCFVEEGVDGTKLISYRKAGSAP